MENPLDDRGQPICPVCFRAIPSGDSVIRTDDLRVHVDCADKVMSWRPEAPAPPSSPATAA